MIPDKWLHRIVQQSPNLFLLPLRGITAFVEHVQKKLVVVYAVIVVELGGRERVLFVQPPQDLAGKVGVEGNLLSRENLLSKVEQTPEYGDLKVQLAALEVFYALAANVFQGQSGIQVLDGVHIPKMLLAADAFALLEGVFLHGYYGPLMHSTEEVISY